MPSIDVTLKLEKETKNCIRYHEVCDPAQVPVLGTLYVSKASAQAMGNPEEITVTVAPAR